MDLTVEDLKEKGGRYFWILVVILLAAWFSNEYMTTKRLVREQASMLFSSVVEQSHSLNNGEGGEKFVENSERLKNELTRLQEEYSETSYAGLGTLLESSVYLLGNDTSKVDSLNDFISKKSNVSNKFELVELEIAKLIRARLLATSDESAVVEEGRAQLKELMLSSTIVPVESSVSYVLSFPQEGSSIMQTMAAVKELIKAKPELEEDLAKEFSRYGIAIPSV